MRFTIGWTLIVVSLLAAVLAVARYAFTRWGSSEVITLVMLVLLVTTVRAWFVSDRGKVFWVGFGLCAWTYLALSLASPLAEHLPTTWLLDGLHDRFYAKPPPAYQDFGEGIAWAQIHAESFRRGGHALFCLLLGLLGGVWAMVLVSPVRHGELLDPPDGSLLKPGWRDGAKAIAVGSGKNTSIDRPYRDFSPGPS